MPVPGGVGDALRDGDGGHGGIEPAGQADIVDLQPLEAGLMRDADVVEGSDALSHLQRLLAVPDVAYLHVHNARPGCYACRVDPA